MEEQAALAGLKHVTAITEDGKYLVEFLGPIELEAIIEERDDDDLPHPLRYMPTKYEVRLRAKGNDLGDIYRLTALDPKDIIEVDERQVDYPVRHDPPTPKWWESVPSSKYNKETGEWEPEPCSPEDGNDPDMEQPDEEDG